MRNVLPATGPVNATVVVPGSKSITSRALVCAALAQGESVIGNASDSEDTALMVNGLNQLGVLVRKSGRDLIVEGKGGRIYAPKFPVPVGNAGTTLRFLIGVAALADGPVVLEGSGRMGERPLAPLTDALRSLGVESEIAEFASRYAVRGGTFRGGETVVRTDISSQFLSSLLMVAPYATENVRIRLGGEAVSQPYVEMTLQVMRRFGVEPVRDDDGFRVKAGKQYQPEKIAVEPDVSAAAFFFAAAAVTGGSVEVEGIRSNSIQGDIRILNILHDIGCQIEIMEKGIRVSGPGKFGGIEADLHNTPDLFPVLTGIALFAETPSRLYGVPHLRHKESDRLSDFSAGLGKLGAVIRVLADGMEITPAPLSGCELDPYDDHRLAMCYALIGLRTDGVVVRNHSCVKKSFPGFWGVWESIERRA